MKVDNNTQNNNKPSNSRKALGIGAGLVVGLCPLPVLLRDKITASFPKALEAKQRRLLTRAEEFDSYETIEKYAKEIISNEGLNGVEIKRDNSSKLLIARFNPKDNKILINEKGFYPSVFQEIGHALNFHNGGFTKFLLRTKGICARVVPLIGISGLFVKVLHNKSDSKNKNLWEKSLDFYSDNAALTLCSAYVPILLEEGLASKKALKLAKPYLTKVQQEKHIKFLILSFLSCLMIPVLFASATNLGVYTKNKIIKEV